MPEDEPKKAESEEKQPGLVGKLIAKLVPLLRQQWWMVLVVVIAIVAPAITVALLLPLTRPKPIPPSLQRALQALDQGNYAQAVRLAQALHEDMSLLDADAPLGIVPYIFGSAAYRDAETSFTEKRRDKLLLAIRYLEEALQLGLPNDRLQEALLLLSKALLATYQPGPARPYLHRLLETSPPTPTRLEAYKLLAEAYATDYEPNFEKALEYLDRYLAARTLSQDQRAQALLQKAEILILQGQRAEAQKILDQISPNSPFYADALIQRAWSILSNISLRPGSKDLKDNPATESAASEALQLLEQAAYRTTSEHLQAGTAYLRAICTLWLGDVERAIVLLHQVMRKFSETPETIAAAYQLGEIYLARKDYDGAAKYFAEALTRYDQLGRPPNKWLPQAELQKRLQRVHDHMLKQRAFSAALELARAVQHAFGKVESLQLQIATEAAWARALLEDLQGLKPQQQRIAEQEARKHFRQAGVLSAKLARERFTTRYYTQDLEQAIRFLLEGRAYTPAINALKYYLANAEPTKRGWALVALGEAYLCYGDPARAEWYLKECLEDLPSDPFVFRAKYLLGWCAVEQNDPQTAENWWQSNLDGQFLAPDSKDYQDTLFALAFLKYSLADFDAAQSLYSEACKRYPDDARIPEAYYRLALISFRKARQQLAQAAKAALPSEVQQMKKQADQLFQEALQNTYQAENTLQTLPTGTDSTELHHSILLLRAAVLYQLGKYDEGLECCKSVLASAPDAREALSACLELALCARATGQDTLVQQALAEASKYLNNMKQTTATTEQTVPTIPLSAQDWEKVLTWLQPAT